MRRGLLALLGLAILGGAVVGCSAEDNGPPPPTAPTHAEQDKAIADIQNNPNMSPEDKQRALDGYKAGVARMGTQGTNPAPGAKNGK